MRTINFPGQKDYPVYVGTKLSEKIAKELSGYEKIAIFAAAPLAGTAEMISKKLSGKSIVAIKVLPDGELSKTVSQAAAAWDFLAEHRITRTDAVLAIGGGAITDMVNFVAATWLRGIDVILMPTTVLAMVDAAIGGKCGINTDRGKNLVGVFNDPSSVYCDTSLLATLDDRDFRAGFAEIAKCGFIADPEIIENILSHNNEFLDFSHEVFLDCLYRAIAVKAQVVAEDPFEKSENGVGRAALNYGHTLGHAIEKHSNFSWRHGDAVAVGMIFAAELAHQIGMLPQDVVLRHRQVLAKLQLPVTFSEGSLAELMPIMSLDKKVQGSDIRFVLLADIAKPIFVVNPANDSLTAAYAKVSKE